MGPRGERAESRRNEMHSKTGSCKAQEGFSTDNLHFGYRAIWPALGPTSSKTGSSGGSPHLGGRDRDRLRSAPGPPPPMPVVSPGGPVLGHLGSESALPTQTRRARFENGYCKIRSDVDEATRAPRRPPWSGAALDVQLPSLERARPFVAFTYLLPCAVC